MANYARHWRKAAAAIAPGDNRNANSLVALKATTGELVWAYQIVRHDLWDYDLVSQSLVADIEVDGVSTPIVAQAT